MFFKASLFIGVIIFSISSHAQNRTRTIYGGDDRINLYEVTDPSIQVLARSTVALISTTYLKKENGTFKFLGQTFGEANRLCTDEPFVSEPQSAFCSGFLIAPDLVLTAGHCVGKIICETTKLVFDYSLKNSGEKPREAPERDVYSCREIVKRIQKDGLDFSLVRLDRPVVGRRPMDLSSMNVPDVGETVFTIGYPSGLPLKVGNGKVRTVSDKTIVTNLDTFSGDSGSPVFNKKYELVGVLVDGDQDFVWNPHRLCHSLKRCPEDGCMGEDATRVDSILNSLNL